MWICCEVISFCFDVFWFRGNSINVLTKKKNSDFNEKLFVSAYICFCYLPLMFTMQCLMDATSTFMRWKLSYQKYIMRIKEKKTLKSQVLIQGVVITEWFLVCYCNLCTLTYVLNICDLTYVLQPMYSNIYTLIYVL